MDETQTSFPETTGEPLVHEVEDIYLNNPTFDEGELVRHEKDIIIDPHDTGGYGLYLDLAQHKLAELETTELTELKNKARDELNQLSPDILEQLFRKFEAFFKSLPAGHGKGHTLRDTINLSGILQDPRFQTEKIDEVELLAGIIAGVFHDDGNSITDRYADAHMVGAHAEVGAVLFGNVAKNILPPNIIKLVQYSIAAHTHYTDTREVPVTTDSFISKPTYIDKVTDSGDREAIWLTRQSDRRDLANFAQLVRNMIVNSEPTQDYNPETKDFNPKESVEENFMTQYGLSGEGAQQQLINHVSGFCRNVFRKNEYTSRDSEYFTKELMTPGVADFVMFLSVLAPDKANQLIDGIEEDNEAAAAQIKGELSANSDLIERYSQHPTSQDDIEAAINKFKNLCRIVEPAPDLEEKLELFESQFPNLNPEDQTSWTKGMHFMSDVLYGRWRDRLAASVETELHLGSKITSQDPAVQQQLEEVGVHLQRIAKSVIASMDKTAEMLRD